MTEETRQARVAILKIVKDAIFQMAMECRRTGSNTAGRVFTSSADQRTPFEPLSPGLPLFALWMIGKTSWIGVWEQTLGEVTEDVKELLDQYVVFWRLYTGVMESLWRLVSPDLSTPPQQGM